MYNLNNNVKTGLSQLFFKAVKFQHEQFANPSKLRLVLAFLCENFLSSFKFHLRLLF